MEVYKLRTDHIIHSSDEPISLNEYVVGISIEVMPDSGSNLSFGLNEGAKVPLAAGEGSRGYGGFTINGTAGVYEGKLNIKFDNPDSNPKALIILTRFNPFNPLCPE